MKIETIIPKYEECIKPMLDSNGYALRLVSFYQEVYKAYSKEPIGNLLLNLRHNLKEIKDCSISDPEKVLTYFDTVNIIEFILINMPLEELENYHKKLEERINRSTEEEVLSRDWIPEKSLLEKYIQIAKK